MKRVFAILLIVAFECLVSIPSFALEITPKVTVSDQQSVAGMGEQRMARTALVTSRSVLSKLSDLELVQPGQGIAQYGFNLVREDADSDSSMHALKVRAGFSRTATSPAAGVQLLLNW